MIKRRKILTWIGLWCLMIFGVLALIFMWLAARPTGYEDFAADHAQSRQRVRALIARPGVDSPSASSAVEADAQPTSPTQPTVVAKPISVKSEPDLFAAIDELINQTSYAGMDQARVNALYKYNRFLKGVFDGVRESQPYIGYERLGLEKTEMGYRITPKAEKEIRHAAHRFPKESEQENPWDEEFRQRLHADLDRVEEFLVRSVWRAPPFESFVNRPNWVQPSEQIFHRLAPAAILRAALLGQSDRAQQLLVNYLEIYHTLHMGRFHETRWYWYLRIEPLLLILGEIEGFPAEGLERAGKILRDCVIDPENYEALSAARRMLVHDRVVRRLKKGNAPTPRNTWHYLFDSRPEKLWIRLGSPIMIKQIDRFAMDYDNDDRENRQSRRKLEKRLARWGALFNVNFWSIRGEFFVASTESSNRPVEWVRLACATAIYFKRHGAWPETIDQLIVDGLDRRFVESTEPDVLWGVVGGEADAQPEAEPSGVGTILFQFRETMKLKMLVVRDPVLGEAARELLTGE